MNYQLPTISVVTPSFNQAQFIRETISSVLGQNYPNLEYVVIDGGSMDSSVDIIKEFDRDLAYWTTESDRGQAHALNKGFEQTSGDIMAWINSDDKYFPWTFSTVAEIFSRFPDVNWIVGTYGWWDENGRLLRTMEVSKNIYDFLLGNYNWIQQESVFWRRKLWLEAGGYVNEGCKYMMDGELWCRFFLLDKLYTVQCLLGGYRSHGHNRGRINQNKCMAEMNDAISHMSSKCPQSVLQNTKKFQLIQNLKHRFALKYTPFETMISRLFSDLYKQAAYDRIIYRAGQWRQSKKDFHVV